MFEILLVSIGLVLVIEGILYFTLASKLDYLISVITTFNKRKIRTVSLTIALIGLCLIYFTFKFYGEFK